MGLFASIRARQPDSPNPLQEKRAAAIAWLGNRWVFHPEYQFDPKHRPEHRVPVTIIPRTTYLI